MDPDLLQVMVPASGATDKVQGDSKTVTVGAAE